MSSSSTAAFLPSFALSTSFPLPAGEHGFLISSVQALSVRLSAPHGLQQVGLCHATSSQGPLKLMPPLESCCWLGVLKVGSFTPVCLHSCNMERQHFSQGSSPEILERGAAEAQDVGRPVGVKFTCSLLCGHQGAPQDRLPVGAGSRR